MTSVIIGHQLSLCNVSSSGLVCPILGHWVWFGSTELTFHLWPPMSSSWRVYTLLTHCLKNGRPAGTTSFEYYYVKGWDTLKKEGWCLFCFGPRHWLNKDNERKKKKRRVLFVIDVDVGDVFISCRVFGLASDEDVKMMGQKIVGFCLNYNLEEKCQWRRNFVSIRMSLVDGAIKNLFNYLVNQSYAPRLAYGAREREDVPLSWCQQTKKTKRRGKTNTHNFYVCFV